MDELPREFYRLDELAARWGKTIDDILQMAVTGNLDLSVYYHGDIYYLTTDNPDGTRKTWNAPRGSQCVYVRVMKSDLRLLLTAEDPSGWTVSSKEFIWEDGKTMCGNRKTEISTSSLVVMNDELLRIETKYPGLLSKSDPQQKELTRGSINTPGYRTGNNELCKAFGVGPNSITSVRKRMRAAGIKIFEIDPDTGKKRLSIMVINEILTSEDEKK